MAALAATAALLAAPAQALADATADPAATSSPAASSPTAEASPTASPADAQASPTPAPSPSASAAPTAAPTASPRPAASGTPSAGPSPSATPSAASQPTATINPAQGQIIATLTAAEAHAILLEKSIERSQLTLMALGQQLLDDQRRLASLDRQLGQVSAAQTVTAARLAKDRSDLSLTVRQLYKHQTNFFAALVSAGGFDGLLRVIGYGDVIVDKEQGLIRSVAADQAALQRSQATLTQNRAQQQLLLDSLLTTQTAIAQEIQVQQDLQDELQQSIDGALAALGSAQSDSPAVAAERARLVRMKTDALLRRIEQAVFSQDALAQLADLPLVDPALAPGRFIWPIPHAQITQGFGPSLFTFEPAYAGFAHFHTGIDLAVPLGTPVFAAADGVVTTAGAMQDGAGNLVGYGNYVVIQHSLNLKSLYGHLLTTLVRAGDPVKKGQLIGLVGSTGNSTGPHTHFELRIADTPVDPLTLMPALKVIGGPANAEEVTPGG